MCQIPSEGLPKIEVLVGICARVSYPKAMLGHELCDTVLIKSVFRGSRCFLKDFRMGWGL